MLETTESKMGISGNLLRTYQKLRETYVGITGEIWGEMWGTVGKPVEEIGEKPPALSTTLPKGQIGRCYEVDRHGFLYPEFVMPEADKDTTDFP